MTILVKTGLVPAICVNLLRDGVEKIHAEIPQDGTAGASAAMTR